MRLMPDWLKNKRIITDEKTEIQKDLDAEHNRQKRSEPFRYPHERGMFAPRTLEEAGL
tara:strand:- start:210 stop:383 length:174 start_codon:yes stop_codon:yes gene_type:complete